ncbi:DUF4158 domain-containing protein [Sinorhizobium meliloti]|uniref:DUF4158 domain-containing protein n=1 Tax=Rhizobium meliloti TaxID=382 RepID=UPI003F14F051
MPGRGDATDRLECELRQRPHDKLGFAIQLCVMRQTGRLLGEDELPPATIIDYVPSLALNRTTILSMPIGRRPALNIADF